MGKSKVVKDQTVEDQSKVVSSVPEQLNDTSMPDPVEQMEAKKGKMFYFKNNRYSGLTILIRGGKDDLGQEGVEHKARFTPYYDTFKGDVIRVGYLATNRKDVADRCREDFSCEEIDEKEYTLATEGDSKNKPLELAPIQQV